MWLTPTVSVSTSPPLCPVARVSPGTTPQTLIHLPHPPPLPPPPPDPPSQDLPPPLPTGRLFWGSGAPRGAPHPELGPCPVCRALLSSTLLHPPLTPTLLLPPTSIPLPTTAPLQLLPPLAPTSPLAPPPPTATPPTTRPSTPDTTVLTGPGTDSLL